MRYTAVEAEMVPLVPVMVTLYWPMLVELPTEIVRKDVPVPLALRVRTTGLRATAKPLPENTVERFTPPVKPLMLVSVIVELPENPLGMNRLVGLADR